MSRNAATRLGTLVALSATFALAFGLYIAGCTSGAIGNDLGLLEPGCRTPSACYVTGVDCDCKYNSVFESTDPNAGGFIPSCKRDPGVDGTCTTDGSLAQCIEPEEVCVGRATTTCNGVGARCLHNGLGQTCAMSGAGDPPNQVATGAAGSIEQRCPYTDDVCCPGELVPDGGTTDGGATGGGTTDGGTTDGGTTDGGT